MILANNFVANEFARVARGGECQTTGRKSLQRITQLESNNAHHNAKSYVHSTETFSPFDTFPSIFSTLDIN